MTEIKIKKNVDKREHKRVGKSGFFLPTPTYLFLIPLHSYPPTPASHKVHDKLVVFTVLGNLTRTTNIYITLDTLTYFKMTIFQKNAFFDPNFLKFGPKLSEI
jgi:hypothetical protein